jgi:hypothetical protein
MIHIEPLLTSGKLDANEAVEAKQKAAGNISSGPPGSKFVRAETAPAPVG